MIVPIIRYGSPILREVAKDIDINKMDIKPLLNDMWDTMYNANGIGLAAPQIGQSIRIFLVDATPLAKDHPELKNFKKVFINVHIIEQNGRKVFASEGCLSIPSINEKVSRYTNIKIKYYDENLQEHTDTYKGFTARILQHEYDHIEGKLFVDYLSPLKKRLLKRKLHAIQKGNVHCSYKTKLQ